MPPLPDTHPDGDPFAEQDALKHNNSMLGKLERNAILEAKRNGLDEHGQQLPGSSSSNGNKSKSTTVREGPDGREIVVVDSSDEELPLSEGEAQATEGEEDEPDTEEEDDQEGEGEGGTSGEDDQSGIEGEEGSTSRAKRGEGEEEEDDEDDSEEDDSEEDTASSIGTGEQEREGDENGDVSMVDAQGDDPTKPKSPIKASTSNGGGGATTTEGGETANGSPKKEKKKRRRRAANRSPSPPPLEPKKPPPTVRLEVTLPARNASSDTPQYNVIQMAKDAGILPNDEIAKPKDATNGGGGEESESDGQGGRRKKDKGKAKAEGDNEAGPPPKKRKRGPNVIVGRFGGYDTEDPFVDDTELALYEPRHYHRPKREGYFVCIGDVDLAPKRGGGGGGGAKRSRPSASAAGTKKVVIGADGKKIVIETPQAGSSSGKIETPFGTTTGGVPTFGSEPPKPARQPGEFSQEMEENFEMLKTESEKEKYEVKNKFPPHLKELLTSVAYRALELNEYDDHFFSRLPSIFPYNKFTLTKLVKREVFPKRINDLTKKQEDCFELLREGIEESYDEQKKEFEEIHQEWSREKENGGAGAGAMKVDGSSVPSTPAAAAANVPTIPVFGAPAISTTTGTPGADDSPAPATDGAAADEDKEPKFKFKFNDTLRSALYWAADHEDTKSGLIEEKQKLEKSTTRDQNPEKPHNQKTARKVIYAKMAALWPDNAMQTNQISREISNYKLKLKKSGEIEA